MKKEIELSRDSNIDVKRLIYIYIYRERERE